jgi:hypothetical protein
MLSFRLRLINFKFESVSTLAGDVARGVCALDAFSLPEETTVHHKIREKATDNVKNFLLSIVVILANFFVLSKT